MQTSTSIQMAYKDGEKEVLAVGVKVFDIPSAHYHKLIEIQVGTDDINATVQIPLETLTAMVTELMANAERRDNFGIILPSLPGLLS